MNLEDFLVSMPEDLDEFLIPVGRALQMHRVSKKTRSAIAKMQCRVDVQPGKMIRQKSPTSTRRWSSGGRWCACLSRRACG
jgi:hypothetical protein